MRECLLMIPVLMVLLCPGEGFAGPIRELGEVPGSVTSLAPFGADGVALLTKKGELILVDAAGKQEMVSLPLRAASAPADFCDFSLDGTKAWFCRFQEPRLYLLDLKNLEAGYQIIDLQGIPKELQVINVCVTADGTLVTDTAKGVWRVDDTGRCAALPPNSVAVPTPKGTTVQLLGPATPAEAGHWKLTQNGSKELAPHSSPDTSKPVRNIRVLGFDGAGRLIFLAALGKGVVNNTFILHAVLEGKSVASLEVESPGRIKVARYHALLGNGTVALLRPGKGEALRLVLAAFP